MKKLVSIFLLIIFMVNISIFSAILVNANDVPQMIADSITAKAGEEVNVNISFKNNPGIVGFKMKAKYDDTVLTLKEAKANGLDAVFSQNITDNPYVMSYVAGIREFNTNGTMIVLTFKVNENAKAGTYPITLTYDEDDIYDLNEDNVYFKVINGGVTVEQQGMTIKGDVNNDGKVNLKDAILIQKLVLRFNDASSIPLCVGDINDDGVISVADIILVMRYII